MASPIQLARQSLIQAYIEIVEPKVAGDPLIPLRFNPTEYQIQKANTFAEIPIPGLESPPIQYIRGASEKLTAEVLVDTSDSLDDVRLKYVNKLRGLLNIDSHLHAPPIVRFVWDKEVFRGVLESCGVTYVLFKPDGVPVRAKLSLALKEYRPVDIQVKEIQKSSPDVDKRYVVRRGDTLSGIAFANYRDPARWRDVARYNLISDPRKLDPGQVLQLPSLTGGA